jgi:hypothetical protein
LLGIGFIAVLEGKRKLSDWVDEMGKNAATKGEERKLVRKQIEELILDTIPRLLSTGIDHKDLNIAWSFNYPTEKMTLDHNLHKWVPVLTDTSQACTFAVVFDCCFQAPGCACSRQAWNPPRSFKLSTKLGFYTKTDREMVPQTIKLNLGKSYWINDQELGLIAEVTEEKTGNRPFSLAVRQSMIMPLRKYFSPRFMVREETDEAWTTWDCIIGS